MQQTFAGQLFNALSWTLIHSLWQGLLLTVLAGTILSATKRSSPSLRYSLLAALLFCFIGTVLVTFAWQWQMHPGRTATQLVNASTLTAHDISPWHHWWNNFTRFMNHYSGWIVPAWAAIVLLKLVRMLVDFYYMNRLRTSYINQPEETWTIRLQQLVREMGIRKQVVLLESGLVNIPLVAGHFKPVILVPLGILTRLSQAEVEAVLLHELAHIRRHDYLINLVQRVTGIAFFFNPGILWLSSLLRAERENCCDDMAITHTNDKLQFVEALLSVKQYSLSSPTLAMNFLGQKNLLLHRVNRIVYNRNKPLNIAELLFFVVSLVCSVLLFSSARRTVTTEAELSAAGRYVQSVTYLPDFIKEKPKQQELTSVKPYREQPSVIRNSLYKPAPPNRSIHESETKVIEPVTAQHATVPAESERETGLSGYNENEKDRANAEHDRIEAEKDRAAAERDRIQAEKD
ncbi:MAG TPA: M56 family metallopeptidase, partial [Chitinophagaceae bacterium]|nr:M56 family metallopeptidase [Chitinophagaceae bacterium]